MATSHLLRLDRVPENLLALIENRDALLWVRPQAVSGSSIDQLAHFVGLPWTGVVLESSESDLLDALQVNTSADDPMARKRGFVQIIDTDPSRITFPQRCLPIYLLHGRHGSATSSDFESQLRRLTILDQIRRSSPREILILTSDSDPLPPEIVTLWSSGFRCFVTFVSPTSNSATLLIEWLNGGQAPAVANLLTIAPAQLINEVLHRYSQEYPQELNVIRVRDLTGTFFTADISDADEPERPILAKYSQITQRDLAPLTPDELAENEFTAFFSDPNSSWRPFAAGLPWTRNEETRNNLFSLLRKLDTVGTEENRVAYIASESGAGGTTLARLLAWECARQGYPTLVAKAIPFVPEGLPLANFFSRANEIISETIGRVCGAANDDQPDEASTSPSQSARRYEAPWVVVFDTLHWQSREGELKRFINELTRSGRPVCILVVTSSTLTLAFYDTSVFRKLAELNHSLDQDESIRLGRHLNRFLAIYGKERPEWQWKQFYHDHTVRLVDGISAFWITLSFWIQRQYDLSESIQAWIFRTFKENATDAVLRDALLAYQGQTTDIARRMRNRPIVAVNHP